MKRNRKTTKRKERYLKIKRLRWREQLKRARGMASVCVSADSNSDISNKIEHIYIYIFFFHANVFKNHYIRKLAHIYIRFLYSCIDSRLFIRVGFRKGKTMGFL